VKVFETLQAILDYIPNCVICQNPMQLSICGHVRQDNRTLRKVFVKLQMRDGILSGKNKDYSIALEAATNIIVEGEDLINKLIIKTINVKQSCPTCSFIITYADQDLPQELIEKAKISIDRMMALS
jgi:hypothetical protein